MNPKTPAQSNARSILTVLALNWQTLTPSQKSAWATFAQNHPRIDSLGQSQVLAPNAQYISSNAQLQAVGLPIIPTPGLTTQVAQNAVITVTAAAGVPTLSVAFAPPTSGYVLQIMGSPQRSPGVSYESFYVRLGAEPSGATSPAVLLVAYTGRFGALVAGRRIFFQSRVIDPNGLDVTGFYRTSVVIAP